MLVCLGVGCTKNVKVGAIISRTGAVAPYGHQVTKGLDLALEQINDEGGFKGGTVELIYRNDESSPDKAAEAAEDLIKNEGVRIIIGAISSASTLRIASICEENRVLLLSPTSSAPSITDAGEYIFRNYPSDVLEGTAMADFAKGLGLRRLVIFSLDNEFGEGLMQVFSNRFASRSRMIEKTFRLVEGDTESLAPMVEEVKELKPDGIYIAAYVNEMVELLKRLHEAGVKTVMMASSSVTEQLPRLAGAAAEKLVYPQPSFDVESTDPAVAPFVEAYRKRHAAPPDIYAAHGYDALKLVLQAMNNTGMAHPDDVKRGLLGLERYQGAAGRTAFDERGDVVRYPQLFVVSGGHAVPFEKFEQEGGELSTPARR